MRRDLDRVSEQDMRLAPARTEDTPQLPPISRTEGVVAQLACQAERNDGELGIVPEATLRPRPFMALPIGKLVQSELEILVDELGIEALKVGIGFIAGLHHLYEAVAQLLRRHAQRMDIGPVNLACVFVMESPGLFEAVVERCCRNCV